MKQFKRAFARKQAQLITFSLKDLSEKIEDFSIGTFSAFAVSNKELLKDAYSISSTDYLFAKDDTAIRAVSDFENNKVSVPLSEDDFDQQTDFWLVVVAEFGTHARTKIIVEFTLLLDDAN